MFSTLSKSTFAISDPFKVPAANSLKVNYKKMLSYGKDLTHVVLTCLLYKSYENTAGKGKIARNEQFLLFPQCFLPIWRTFCYFREEWNSRL